MTAGKGVQGPCSPPGRRVRLPLDDAINLATARCAELSLATRNSRDVPLTLGDSTAPPSPCSAWPCSRSRRSSGPTIPLLKNRARLCSQLAVAAALGFLLLLPLQTIASLQTGRSLNNAQSIRINGAEAKLKTLR